MEKYTCIVDFSVNSNITGKQCVKTSDDPFALHMNIFVFI